MEAEILEGIAQLEKELGDVAAGEGSAEEKKKAEEHTKKKLQAHARYMRYSRAVSSQGLKCRSEFCFLQMAILRQEGAERDPRYEEGS